MKVIIINGSGGSGKDTCVELVKTYLRRYYDVRNISTIDKTKTIACEMGWHGEKDEKSRQFLADLKALWTNYNNGANMEVLIKVTVEWKAEELYNEKEKLVFIHCREPEAIDWFVKSLKDRGVDVITLLVEREGIETFSNQADSNVAHFDYDLKLLNNGTYEYLEKLCKKLADILIDWEDNFPSKIIL